MLQSIKSEQKAFLKIRVASNSPSDISINLNAPRVSATLKMTQRVILFEIFDLNIIPLLLCHSERSAEERQVVESKTMFLHGVELFLHGFSVKKARVTRAES